MTSPFTLRNLPPPDIEGTRPSRETISSSPEAPTPPLRLPILIVRAVVILASSGLFAVQFVAGSANGPRLIAVTATVGVVAFVWNVSRYCLCMLRYLLVEPNKWFKARLAMDVAIVIGSFVCVGVVHEKDSSSGGQFKDFPVYLTTLFIIGGGTAGTIVLALIQKVQMKRVSQPQRFVQPSGSAGVPPMVMSQGGDLNAGPAAVHMTTNGAGMNHPRDHQRAMGGAVMV